MDVIDVEFYFNLKETGRDSDVISGDTERGYISRDVPVKFSESRSNRLRVMRRVHFVINRQQTNYVVRSKCVLQYNGPDFADVHHRSSEYQHQKYTQLGRHFNSLFGAYVMSQRLGGA